MLGWGCVSCGEVYELDVSCGQGCDGIIAPLELAEVEGRWDECRDGDMQVG